MNKIKHFFGIAKDSIKDNGVQICEIIALIILVVAPFGIDIPKLFEMYLTDIVVSPDNVIPYLVIKGGNVIMSIALFIIGLWKIRSYNKDVLMNRRNIYHRYPYMWYYFCAKVLGIKKCSLILVPIYLQFKLVIHNVFEEFPLDDSDYPVVENEGKCTVIKYNFSDEYNEVNLMLEDTYPMEITQLPDDKNNLPIIKISRNDGSDVGRHFSNTFIENVINVARTFPNGVQVNIYATTNPMNTMNIARRAFRLATRGNIKHLFVYQQMSSGNRKFETKGHKIY